MNTKIKYTLLLILAVSSCRLSVAQSVIDLIKQRPSYASCNYDVYPDSITAKLTPAPAGKKPFYISHYGRHGSRYISNRSGFDTPYFMMLHADSLDELTPTGQQVLRHMNNIMRNTEGRWGELTGYGKQQMQKIGRRMAERFPEVFHPGANVTCISTVVPRCIESMGSLAMEMLQVCPQLHITMQASKRTQWYMNYQDKKLRRNYMTPEAQKALDAYTATRMGNTRLMELIFKNPDIAEEFVNQEDFSYYLMKMGLFQLNTNFNRNTNLIGLFNTNDLYRMWQVDNAYWYLQHGACKLNGGNQPYTQRHLLKKMIADADSCIKLPDPGAQLRFGHETVLLPLVCLIGVNGFDFSTDNLDELEGHGWWCSSVFPMAGNLQFIFYRSNPKDKDVLVKVLLNEVEATLPISTDCAPYYHWSDFRQYCLNKLAAYKQ
ncbi:Histidine phosphatase superfamily (branch 2) [Xylanibacter ruminicola]|uniref:Multiple inositol polyphosphate phosphatase 1 n=1 Tax=Xylanibacter ruminicola TaxID=839 RepID=A0A1M7K403_XYLRU|nr:histidine-type phosphatase [Xylanibacter ruminicola]SHM60019.1 Histidine phosphatase superfamily (branch 2) [Xylanibacter ruminicola]